jgi:hypothetical protein
MQSCVLHKSPILTRFGGVLALCRFPVSTAYVQLRSAQTMLFSSYLQLRSAQTMPFSHVSYLKTNKSADCVVNSYREGHGQSGAKLKSCLKYIKMRTFTYGHEFHSARSPVSAVSSGKWWNLCFAHSSRELQSPIVLLFREAVFLGCFLGGWGGVFVLSISPLVTLSGLGLHHRSSLTGHKP